MPNFTPGNRAFSASAIQSAEECLYVAHPSQEPVEEILSFYSIADISETSTLQKVNLNWLSSPIWKFEKKQKGHAAGTDLCPQWPIRWVARSTEVT